jgi:three-Cys-motif partner protein
MSGKNRGKAHRFGGDWTSTKLDVLAKYLAAYTKVLKNKPSVEHPFRKAYIDAFAGTGSRMMSEEGATKDGNLPLPSLPDTASQKLLDGSARMALKVEPRFDHYLFIERDKARCRELEALKSEFPDLAKDIRVKRGEANEEIRTICKKDWRSHRAVLFLDPYGMQVEWQTIEAVAKTKAIDLWLLFPLGIGVNRLLTRSGEIPVGWRSRLDKLLGRTDWYDEFYKIEHEKDLFGKEQERVVKATNEKIGRYFTDRLRAIFPGVAEPGVLRNSSNNPLYLLCFAAGNKSGAPTALKIANSLLKEIR